MPTQFLPTTILAALFATACAEHRPLPFSRNLDAGADGSSGVCAPDVGECDFITNRGCPPGLGCYLRCFREIPDPIGGTTCENRSECTNIGEAEEGMSCDPARGSRDCRPGLVCSNTLNKCARLCCSDTDCASLSGAPQACFFSRILPNGVGECTQGCLVTSAENGCPPDAPHCHSQVTQTNSGVALCQPVTNRYPVYEGGVCLEHGDCTLQHICIREAQSSERHCRRACLRTEDCLPNRRCLEIQDTASYGACIPN